MSGPSSNQDNSETSTSAALALKNHEVAGLVAQAQAGSVMAFERLIFLYQGKVISFARSFTADPEEANDLAQEALIRVYRSLGGFRFQSSFSTWLFRIVKNLFLDHAKSRRNKESHVERSLDDDSVRELSDGTASAEVLLVRREEEAELWTALRKVPEVYRTVLVLADMQGWSYEEIATVAEAPLGTIKSRLKRGRDALREEILTQRRVRDKQGKPRQGP